MSKSQNGRERKNRCFCGLLRASGLGFCPLAGFFFMVVHSQTVGDRGWVIAQRWTHLLFLSYAVEPELVQARLPEGLEVDVADGRA